MGIHIGATKGQKYRGKKLLRAPADGTGVVEERNERTGQIKCRLSGAAVNLGIWCIAIVAAHQPGPNVPTARSRQGAEAASTAARRQQQSVFKVCWQEQSQQGLG